MMTVDLLTYREDVPLIEYLIKMLALKMVESDVEPRHTDKPDMVAAPVEFDPLNLNDFSYHFLAGQSSACFI